MVRTASDITFITGGKFKIGLLQDRSVCIFQHNLPFFSAYYSSLVDTPQSSDGNRGTCGAQKKSPETHNFVSRKERDKVIKS
jgi:hypothetical protein